MMSNGMIPFRPLNEREKSALCGVREKNRMASLKLGFITSLDVSRLKVSYETMPGGFTVCLLRYVSRFSRPITDSEIEVLGFNPKDQDSYEIYTTLLWRGVSRCSYKDKFNPIRGQMLAFVRAITLSTPVNCEL